MSHQSDTKNFQNNGGLRGQLALITGATAGIGLATAEALADQGCHLVLVGRRDERLRELSQRLTMEAKVEVHTIALDVSHRAATEAAFAKAAPLLGQLSILVNNAGKALGTDPMPTGDLDDWEGMVDTNIKGLLYVTRLSLPHLMKRKGHIVNIGSVAGRWTYPGGGVYCATKFAVRALTEGLRMDLMGTGVRVTNIAPGMVETEFSEVRFQGDQARAKKVYQGFDPLSAADIAETIVWCLDRPAHVNIQELVIFPTDQAGVGPAYLHKQTEKA